MGHAVGKGEKGRRSEDPGPASRRCLGRAVCVLAAGPERTAREDVGVDPRGPVCIHRVDENSLLWKPGPLSFAAFPARSLHGFLLITNSGPLLRSRTAFTCPRGVGAWGLGERWGSGNARVFQAPSCFSKSHRPTTQRGLRDPESHFWRGERRGMVLLAPTPMRARRGHSSPWPRAARKVAHGSVLQRPLAGERHLVCGGVSGVKIICGTGRGREKALWGRYPLGVTGLEVRPPPSPRSPHLGGGGCKLHRPKAAGAGEAWLPAAGKGTRRSWGWGAGGGRKD